MDFFSDCKTQSEAKDRYRKLAKLFHPDKGGDKELMVEMTKQFERWSPEDDDPTGFKYNWQNPPFNNFRGHSYKSSPFGSGVFTSEENLTGLKIRIHNLEQQLSDERKKLGAYDQMINSLQIDNRKLFYKVQNLEKDLKDADEVISEFENITFKRRLYYLFTGKIYR